MARRGSDSREGRLRTLHFVAAAVLAALVPLILFAGFWIRAELNKGQRDLEAFLTTRAEALSERVDSEVGQQLCALSAVTAMPMLDDPNPAAFRIVATRLLDASPSWSALEVLDPQSGRVLIGMPENVAPIAVPQERVQAVVESRKPRVFTLAPSGDTAEAPKPSDILFLAPVIRDGAVRSVAAIVLKGERFQTIIEKQHRDPKLLATVVDDRQRVLARSRAPESFIGRPANEKLTALANSQAVGLIDGTSLEREPVSSAYVRSSLTGWLSVVGVDRQEFEGMSRRSVWATVAAGALSLTLAGVLAVFLFHNMMERRLSGERLAASRALGDLDARLLATTQEALGEQRKAASEREVLLREIYHRVKNNLQIVQSLLRLGSRDLTSEQREPFDNAVRRIGAMARVHTLLYNSPDLGSIDFKDYLEELSRDMSDAFGAEEREIATLLEASSMRVPLDTAVPLAFIAVEILTNAFRHGFPDGLSGTITITTSREDGRGVLTIKDTGVGLPADKGSKRALGLTIVAKLVQQIGGTLKGPEPGGSTFRIVFPLDQSESASLLPQPA